MPTILIVEDDKALHTAYRTILTKEKYNVLSAYNGQEALSVIEENKVDLILLDINMPKMNGIEFLENYKNINGTKVIVFSNLDSEKDINKVYDLGAHRYILKAWASPLELVKIVADTLN